MYIYIYLCKKMDIFTNITKALFKHPVSLMLSTAQLFFQLQKGSRKVDIYICIVWIQESCEYTRPYKNRPWCVGSDDRSGPLIWTHLFCFQTLASESRNTELNFKASRGSWSSSNTRRKVWTAPGALKWADSDSDYFYEQQWQREEHSQ